MVSNSEQYSIDVSYTSLQAASDKLLGGAMLLTASIVFVYYTVWAILLVRGLVSTILYLSNPLSNSHSSTLPPLYTTSSQLGNGQSAYQRSSSSSD